jgi:hypothetical protein
MLGSARVNDDAETCGRSGPLPNPSPETIEDAPSFYGHRKSRMVSGTEAIPRYQYGRAKLVHALWPRPSNGRGDQGCRCIVSP